MRPVGPRATARGPDGQAGCDARPPPSPSAATGRAAGPTILPGFRFAPGSIAVEQRAEHRDARRRDVLLEPAGVLGADGVVVRQRRAGVHERLLDRRLDTVVLVDPGPRRRGRAEGEREVQAGARVVAVRQVAHDVAADAEVRERAARGRHHVVVEDRQRRPRRGGLRHVGERAAVEQVVADVGRVELLLVVELAGARPDARRRRGADTILPTSLRCVATCALPPS